MRVFYILYVSRDEGILHFVCVPGMMVFYICMCSRDGDILHFVCVLGMRVFYMYFLCRLRSIAAQRDHFVW